ncbi:MAG: D-alanyl-D-alanine carboxypeptidase/D-alanyl-D-alanine-endopeptidase [Cardiobacteriaceae bacterium]|nr:D-alanyl-D-alanine carboxypeptidase/D-alanyl-D-alanine-endopeptidase [Cardiobacteriaceae bacterium]
MPNVNLDFPSISFDEPDIYYGNSADSNFNEKEELENSNPYQANTSAQSNNSAKSKKVPTTIIELSNTEKSNTEESNNQTNEYQFEDNSPQAAATDAFADNLPAAISNLIAKHQVNKENFSLIIQEVSRDKPLASLNAGKLRSPASVTKIFTTAAGLIAMGDDYRYPTRFFVDAMPDKDGIVNGNLYIQGGGDPFLVEERLRDFIKELRGKGVRHIAGNIIIDNSLYKLDLNEKDTFGFDGNQYSAYNAVPSPIMVNFRTIKIIFTPAGKKGVNISLSPQINNWQIDNQMTINSGKCSENFNPTPELSRDDKGFAVLRLTGKYSTNCGKSDISVVMGEAVEQMYYLFRDLWYAEGGSFDGRGEIGVVPNSAELIYTGQSLPMSELVQKMNTMSNNVMTRQLMLTLGAYLYDVPGNLEKGRKGVLETLTAFGVATDGAVLDNGSGLSRKTRISAQGFSSLLINMYRSEKLREPFWNSLAVCGETGTLKKRFKGTAMQGKIRGKTGTIDKVRGFAGYVQAQSGRVFVVVMIGNNNAALPSRYMQDDVLSWVYQQ